MRIQFTQNEVMQIIAECDVETMALKYWLMEYAKHGNKVLEVVPYDTNRLSSTETKYSPS